MDRPEQIADARDRGGEHEELQEADEDEPPGQTVPRGRTHES
jgi:hypothetical protein